MRLLVRTSSDRYLVRFVQGLAVTLARGVGSGGQFWRSRYGAIVGTPLNPHKDWMFAQLWLRKEALEAGIYTMPSTIDMNSWTGEYHV